MKVLIAESPSFTSAALELLRAAGWRTELYAGPLADLPEALREADGAIVRFGFTWTADALRRSGRPRFLAVAATGTDHIDRSAAQALGIEVVSLAGHPGLREITATPEHAFGLMLALLRHTAEAHASVLRGEWNRDAYFGHQLRGKTVGIVGLGRTGSAFASMVHAFGALPLYFDPYVESELAFRCGTLAELAGRSDIVAVHAVLNAETRGLLGRTFFDAVKPGAFLVNTARGALVDESCLLEALRSGALAGAALDVLRDEPEKGSPLVSPLVDYARQHNHLLLTPHIGGATMESIEGAETLLARVLVDRFAAPPGG